MSIRDTQRTYQRRKIMKIEDIVIGVISKFESNWGKIKVSYFIVLGILVVLWGFEENPIYKDIVYTQFFNYIDIFSIPLANLTLGKLLIVLLSFQLIFYIIALFFKFFCSLLDKCWPT